MSYIINSNCLAKSTTTTTATVLKPTTTVAAATEVGFLTSEAEGGTVVIRSSDISGSEETRQLNLMDAYPIGQVTSTYSKLLQY